MTWMFVLGLLWLVAACYREGNRHRGLPLPGYRPVCHYATSFAELNRGR